MSQLARCDRCRRYVRVRQDGTLERHSVTLRVSRSAVPSVGTGAVRRPCPGSGATVEAGEAVEVESGPSTRTRPR